MTEHERQAAGALIQELDDLSADREDLLRAARMGAEQLRLTCELLAALRNELAALEAVSDIRTDAMRARITDRLDAASAACRGENGRLAGLRFRGLQVEGSA